MSARVARHGPKSNDTGDHSSVWLIRADIVLIWAQCTYFQAVLSKVDDFATFKKVEVHAKNYTF